MMETDKEQRIIYSLLLEEKLEAFYLSFRTQLHVYKVVDLMHVTRKDLSRIGLLSGPDVRRFERVIGKVTKNAGLKGIFTKVLPKKQKQLIDIPTTILLWEEFEPVIIKAEDLTLKEILGAGNFGKVYKGEWLRRSGGHEVSIDVAVKCLKEESNESFIKEVSILSQLDQKHDNIIKLYGISIQENGIKMVTEYAQQGSLLEKLERKEIRLVSLLCQFAVQIASGMMYLEHKGLVHRDLAARNILVTAHNQVKISDFGLAKLVGKNDQWIMTAMEALPIRWLAIESLLEGKFTSASDVWSFGVVLWEMFSFGEHPWASSTSKEVVEKLQKGKRLAEPRHCPSNIYSIILRRCWAHNPSERIRFEEARTSLISIHPTSSFAVSSNHTNDGLQYTVGDIIIALKPLEGHHDVWLGQNERTLEFGRYIKSQTQPIQTKIPFTMNASINPDAVGIQRNRSSEKSNLGERSKPITIPGNDVTSHRKLLSAENPKLRSPLQEVNVDLTHIEQRVGSTSDANTVYSDISSSDTVAGSDASPGSEPFYMSIDEAVKTRIKCQKEKESIRKASIPTPDKLASGTAKRYPAINVKYKSKDAGNTSMPDEAEAPDYDLHSDDEKPDLPPKPVKSGKKKASSPHRKEHSSRNPSLVTKTATNDHGIDVLPSNASHRGKVQCKPGVVKVKPKKPPRDFSFDDSYLQSAYEADYEPDELSGRLYENSGVFDLDPSAWVRSDSSTGKMGPSSNPGESGEEGMSVVDGARAEEAGPLPFDTVVNPHKQAKMKMPMKKIKKLRKTQSLESINIETESSVSYDENSSQFFDKNSQSFDEGSIQSQSLPESDPDELLSSSGDKISYKKLENETYEDISARKSIFGLKIRKTSRNERSTGDTAAELISEVQRALPESSQNEVQMALEVSKWNVKEAVKYLKVSELVRLGLCPESTCLDMLKTYDWNVLEASYAIKIHYLMAIHLDISLDCAAKLLRENQWDLNSVLNTLKVPAYITECREIGFSVTEAESILAAVGQNVDKALGHMKVRRVADITQKSEDYCRRILELCQWKVDRAITSIVESA